MTIGGDPAGGSVLAGLRQRQRLGAYPATSCLVVQHDRFNRSAIATTVVVAITSNLRLAAMPGNVRLGRGDAGLPQPSVVNVSQIRTIDRATLRLRVGMLRRAKVDQVLAGLALLLGTDEIASRL